MYHKALSLSTANGIYDVASNKTIREHACTCLLMHKYTEFWGEVITRDKWQSHLYALADNANLVVKVVALLSAI